MAKAARQMCYHSGVAAENRIAQDYERRGFLDCTPSLAGRRW